MNQTIPNCIDTERNVLGYCLMNAGYLDTCRADIEPDDFQLQKHVAIWASICRLYDVGEAVDRLTVYADLLKRGEDKSVDGLGYLTEIDSFLPTVPSIASYIRQLHEFKMRRRIVYAAEHITKSAQDTSSDIDSIVETFGRMLVEINEQDTNRGPVSTKDLIDQIGITALLSPRKKGAVSLPFPRLQEVLGGLREGQMVVLMAATSRGKTSMALQITAAAAEQGHTPAVWAMEMGAKTNFQRMVTQISGVYATKQFTTHDERDAHRRAIEQLTEHPVHFDTTSRSVPAFLATLRQIRSKIKLGLAVVDHLQLIRSSGARNRAQEVSENSRALKLGAMDLGIPFLALSQVDRGSVKGDGKIGLHSAKESGDIENDADVVMWIDAGELSRDQDSSVTLWIGKQREGPSGFGIPMVFRPQTQTFMEVAE